MDLYLVRHAIAEERSADLSDAQRALTPKGRERFGRCVRGLDQLGVRLERVLHSPLVRAVQTAELLAPLASGPPTVNEGLAARPDESLLAELGPGRIALVGHEPWLSELAAWLTLGDRRAADAFVRRREERAWRRRKPPEGNRKFRRRWRPETFVL